MSSTVKTTAQADETHLKVALEAAQMGTWDWNLVTNEIIYSEQFGLIFGISAHSFPLTPESLLNSVHPDDRQKVKYALAEALEGTDSSFEFRVTWPDGTVHWIGHKGQVYYDDVGQPMRVMGVVMDITDRKQAQMALQAAQERFAGILEIANDAIISINAKQQITLFNQGAEKIFGYTAAEVLGQPLSLLLPEHFATFHGQHIQDFQNTAQRSPIRRDHSIVFSRRKDGTEFPAEVSISKLELAGETIFTAILRDVSERQQTEAALQQRSHHLAAVIAAQQDITINSANLDEVMTAIVEHTQHLTQADGAAIEILEGNELIYRAASGIALNFMGLRLKVAHSLSGHCVQTGQLLRCDETETDSRVVRSLCRQVGIRAMLLVPLHYQGQRIGVLKVLSVTPAKFTEPDTQTLQLMSGFLAASICLATESETKTLLLAALQESENRYRSVVNVLAEGIVLQQGNGQIIACNRSAEQILGLTTEQMMGRSSLDFQWRTIHEDGSTFPGETHPAIVTLRPGSLNLRSSWEYIVPMEHSSGFPLIPNRYSIRTLPIPMRL
jgi:PAS domain S-box-containing protein